MQLPRHYNPRSNVSELQSVRAGAISPAEAANVQMAKYGAVAAGAKAIGDVMTSVSDVRKAAQDAKDEITWQTGQSNLKAAFTSLDNDENLKKPVQDDGTSTVDYYNREADAIIKTYKTHLDQITDPKAKQRAIMLARNKETEVRAEMEGKVGVLESRVAEGELFTGISDALRNGDTDGARALVATGKARLLLDPEAAEKWTVAIEKQETKDASFELIQDVNAGYAISQKEGDKRLGELVRNTDIDPQVRDMAIDGAEEKKVEWGKTRDSETKADEVTAILAFGNDTAQATAGFMSYEQVDSAYKAKRYGDPKTVGAANRRNQLFKSITSAVGRMETELNIRETYENGQFMLDDTKHRDALSAYEQEMTSEMDGAERIKTIGDISRTLGTVSTHTSNTLNLSGKSEAALTNNIDLYRELISDESVFPNMHLTGEAAAALEDTSVLMDAGVGKVEAASTAWANQHISELEKTERTQSWVNSGVKSANESYDTLLDSDYYEEPGFGDVDDPPAAMVIEYGAIYKSVYMQTGNDQTAQNIANRAIQKSWVMTNFNSADPDEYTIEKNGMPGDTHRIRAGVIREFEDDSFKIRKPDGTYKTSKIDADNVTFEALDTEDGVRRWGVMQNGVPLFRVSDSGIEVAEYSMDESRLTEYQKKTAQHEATEQRLTDIKHEVKRLEGLTETNPYRTVMPGFTASRRDRIKSLGREKKRLDKELPGMSVEF